MPESLRVVIEDIQKKLRNNSVRRTFLSVTIKEHIRLRIPYAYA